jgi:hypothetical protein
MKTSHVFHFKRIVPCSNFTRDCYPMGKKKIRQFYDLPKYYKHVQTIFQIGHIYKWRHSQSYPLTIVQNYKINVYDLNVCICKNSLEYKSYMNFFLKSSLLSFFCLFCLHSKTITFNSNVLGFRVCESFEAFTLWLLSPYCFNFDAIMWKKKSQKFMNTKKESKIGVVNYKLQALSIVTKFRPSSFLPFFYFFIFHQIPFVCFLKWLY